MARGSDLAVWADSARYFAPECSTWRLLNWFCVSQSISLRKVFVEGSNNGKGDFINMSLGK